MDTNAIVSLVGSLGFPIVCCGFLFYYMDKRLQSFFNRMNGSMGDLTTSINSNTLATQELVTTVRLINDIKEADNNG